MNFTDFTNFPDFTDFGTFLGQIFGCASVIKKYIPHVFTPQKLLCLFKKTHIGENRDAKQDPESKLRTLLLPLHMARVFPL